MIDFVPGVHVIHPILSKSIKLPCLRLFPSFSSAQSSPGDTKTSVCVVHELLDSTLGLGDRYHELNYSMNPKTINYMMLSSNRCVTSGCVLLLISTCKYITTTLNRYPQKPALTQSTSWDTIDLYQLVQLPNFIFPHQTLLL